jgi:hypothetical protein
VTDIIEDGVDGLTGDTDNGAGTTDGAGTNGGTD